MLVIQYIRVSWPINEGFTSGETYDIHIFFKDYPLEQICPIYNVLYKNTFTGEKINEKGEPVPDDIAAEKAKAVIRKAISSGPFPCNVEWSLPKTTDLDTVVAFTKGLDPMILVKGHSTLLYCYETLQKSLDSAEKSVATIPSGLGFASGTTEGFAWGSTFVKTEGFITECSAMELSVRGTVPLQCIPPESMKGTEQEIIKKMGFVEQSMLVKKKQEITSVLKAVHDNYMAYLARLDSSKPVKTIPVLIAECNGLITKLNALKKKLSQ